MDFKDSEKYKRKSFDFLSGSLEGELAKIDHEKSFAPMEEHWTSDLFKSNLTCSVTLTSICQKLHNPMEINIHKWYASKGEVKKWRYHSVMAYYINYAPTEI